METFTVDQLQVDPSSPMADFDVALLDFLQRADGVLRGRKTFLHRGPHETRQSQFRLADDRLRVGFVSSRGNSAFAYLFIRLLFRKEGDSEPNVPHDQQIGRVFLGNYGHPIGTVEVHDYNQFGGGYTVMVGGVMPNVLTGASLDAFYDWLRLTTSTKPAVTKSDTNIAATVRRRR